MIPPPEDLLAAARRAAPLLVTSHLQPDGDAVGSVVGAVAAWEAQGSRACGWLHDPCPPTYRLLPGVERLWIGPDPPPGFPQEFEAALVLECPTLDRTGLASQLESLAIWNVDHHLGNSEYGRYRWVDPAAPAVAAMLESLFSALDWDIGSQAADCLLTGLVADTGGFRFGNTTPEAFETASRLLRRGANPERVSAWLYENRSLASIHLERTVLERLHFHAGGQVATSLLTRDDLDLTSAEPGDLEGLVEKLRSISGVEAVGLLREDGPGSWKASLRSRGRTNVELVARAHGGGGHRNAAGCRLEGTSSQVRATLAAELERAVSESVRIDG